MDNKGLIRLGMDVDLVVFDTHTVGSPATYDNPRQYPDGIHHVLINKEFIVKEQKHTGDSWNGDP